MQILVIGRDGRIAKELIPILQKVHRVVGTTRRNKEDRFYLDLRYDEDVPIGYDCLVLCACDFKTGRSESDQKLKDDINIAGIKRIIKQANCEYVVFLSSYLSNQHTAYGKQKKAIEKYISVHRPKHLILNLNRISDGEYRVTAKCISVLINNHITGKVAL